MNGFIKLHIKFTEWEWYKDTNTKVLFLHCLLKANWKDAKFKGHDIKRGSFVTSLKSLSKETGLTIRQTRTAIEHLILTGELTNKSYSKFRIITVNNYEKYQETTNEMTNCRQKNDKQVDNQPTTIEDIYIYLTSYLERIYTRALSSLEVQKVNKWIEEYDYKVILHAIDISAMNNAKNFNYVEGILRNWKTAGFKTLEDVLSEEERIAKTKEKLSKDDDEFVPIDEDISNFNWLDYEKNE